MKIGVIADSHENMDLIRKAVDVFNEQEVDLVCHCGDVISPITAKEFANLEASFVGVFGNNDGERHFLRKKFKEIGSFHEEPYEFKVDEKVIQLMHRPLNIDALVDAGRIDFVFYGNTHSVDIRQDTKPVVVNPGESGAWLTGKGTVAIVDTEKKEEPVELIELALV